MFRKILIALVAFVTIGVAAGTTGAQARGYRGRGYYRGGWGRGYRGYGWRGGGYYVGGGCWRSVRVATPYGWVWRRVWVCG